MQVTVTIPDSFADQAQARGMTTESFVEGLIADKSLLGTAHTDTQVRLARFEKFFEEMASHSDKVPLLPDEALTRESFYQDHD